MLKENWSLASPPQRRPQVHSKSPCNGCGSLHSLHNGNLNIEYRLQYLVLHILIDFMELFLQKFNIQIHSRKKCKKLAQTDSSREQNSTEAIIWNLFQDSVKYYWKALLTTPKPTWCLFTHLTCKFSQQNVKKSSTCVSTGRKIAQVCVSAPSARFSNYAQITLSYLRI